MMLSIEWKSCPKELVKGLKEIAEARSEEIGAKGQVVRFVEEQRGGAPGFTLAHGKVGATIRYSRACDAYRGLGQLLGQAATGKFEDVTQECAFTFLGAKLDCSRNGVPTVETVKTLLRQIALMGYNAFALYMEDTYEIPGEPFFGYLRGRYSVKDLKEIDDYAFALGIEVLGHSQMLGHVEQILHWPAYADLKDVTAVFMADHAPTYKLLEKMITTLSTSFRSRRIFSGVDEAHGLGSGRFKRLKGGKPSFEIFTGHLQWLVNKCKELGLKPMSSSDMYFRLGSKDNWYYDENAVIPPEVIKNIPPEIQLIYWDYYHTEISFYERWIDKHRALGNEPMVMGGVWTWNHFWAHLPFSLAATEALIKGCRAKGIKETMCTLWGDDGMQVDPFSALPGLAYYAELSFNEEVDADRIRTQTWGACGEDIYESYQRASGIDLASTVQHMRDIPDSPSTWLLWEDPLLGLMQPQISNRKLPAHHRKLSAELASMAKGRGPLARRLRFPEQIARVLSMKIDLHPRLSAAVRKNDKAALRGLLKNSVDPLRREVDKLWKIHRDMWLETYRPFGLEIIEQRYGGLRARLETLSDRLKKHVAGQADAFPEFRQKLLKIHPEDIYTMIKYSDAASPSIER